MGRTSLAAYGPAAVSRGYNTYGEAQARNARQGRADFWKKIVLPVAAFATGGAALAAMGGGAAAGSAAASVPGAVGASAAPLGGGTVIGAGASTAARMPWMQIGAKATDTLFGIYGNRQQMKSNREALAYQQASDQQARAIEAEERAEMKRQFDLQQGELKRQWDATQKFETDRYAASEDERLYRRRMDDEREIRRAPYRQASADSLARIPGILASGRTSPGMGSLGSYRR